MVLSSSCALDRFFNNLLEKENYFPFESALIYGYVPEDLKESLNLFFPTNEILATQPVNNNYFGVPARGIVSSPTLSDSSEIMVNLMWSYEDEETADKAFKDLQFMQTYLGIKKAHPDIISNWNVERVGNQFGSTITFPRDKAYDYYLALIEDFPYTFEDVLQGGKIQQQAWMQAFEPTRRNVFGVTQDYLQISAPSTSIFSNEISLKEQDQTEKNSTCDSYRGSNALSGDNEEKPTDDTKPVCRIKQFFDLASFAIDIYTINNMLTQWFGEREGLDLSPERSYTLAAFQMLSMTSDLLNTNMLSMESDPSMIANVGYTAAALRFSNFGLHFYDYVSENYTYDVMPVLYSNMFNLPLKYAIDQNCQLNFISLASAVVLPTFFTMYRQIQCNSEDYWQAYIDGSFLRQPNLEVEFMRVVNNCQFFGKSLGKFDEFFYNNIYPKVLYVSSEKFLRFIGLASTDLEREINGYSITVPSLGNIDLKGPISLVSALSALRIQSGVDAIKEANQFNELLALIQNVDTTKNMTLNLTPLHLNTMLEQPEIVKVLFANGANPTAEVSLPSSIDGSEEGYEVWQLNIENEELKQIIKKHMQDYYNYEFQQKVPDPPLNLAEKEDLRDISVLGIQWTEPWFVGQAEITKYQIFRSEQGLDLFEMKTETTNSFGSVDSCTPGTFYDFRVEAINDFGSSVPSVPITLKCGYYPTAPTSPTITWDSVSDRVDISWNGFAANGYDITLFEVEFYSESQRVFVLENVECDGSSPVTIQFNTCSVQLSTLTNPTGDYRTELGDTIKARIYVTNQYGKQVVPSPQGESDVYCSAPNQPRSLAENTLQGPKTSRQYTVSWTQPDFDGGLGLVGYKVYHSENSGVFTLIQEINHRTNSLTIPCTTGSNYQTKVYALNSCRTSESIESNIITPYCGAEPDTPTTPSTSVTADETTLTWTAPFDGGYSISGYTVYIIKSTSSFEVSPSACVAGNMSPGSTSCTLKLDTLAAAPFNLLQGDDITIQVKAHNSYGDSDLSVSGNGGVMVFEPDAPLSLQDIPSITLEDRIGISWIEGANNGGETVIDYQVHYDAGRNDGVYELLLDNILPEPINQRTFSGLTSGTTYRFKVRSRNSVGFSDWSNVVAILAAQLPDPPLSPSTSISDTTKTDVIIRWSPAPNRGSPISAYTIKVRASDNISYHPIAACGSDPSIYSCTIDVSVLKAAPFELPWGSEVFALLTATNAYGNSLPSYQGRGAFIYTNPIDPTTLANDDTVTDDTTIKITWVDPDVNFGGTPVIDYTVFQKDDQTNTWAEAQAGITDTFVTLTGFTLGVTYTFRVQSRNAYDVSLGYSNEAAILAYRRPYQIAAPTTTYNYDDGTVTIDWNDPDTVTYPPSTGGSDITSYTITIRQSDGTTFTEETLSCNGADSNIMTFTQCTIPVATLMAPPFSIPWGGSIQAKVSATNARDVSDVSDASNEAQIYTQPDAPTGLAETYASRTQTSLVLTWTAPTNTGGLSLGNYRVSIETAGSWSTLDDNVAGTTYTATGLTPGSTYQFQVEAQNAQVYGPACDPLSLKAGYIPDVPSNLQTTNVNDEVQFQWSLTSNGGEPITRYTVMIGQNDGGYSEYLATCDGSSASVYSSGTCTIPLSILRQSPYSIPQGNPIQFYVSATNLHGTSSNSIAAGTAVMINTPDAPVTLSMTAQEIDSFSVTLSWQDGASNGGAMITNYIVQEDQATGTWIQIGTSTMSYWTGLVNFYKPKNFRVKAVNQAGESDWSSSFTFPNCFLQTEMIGSSVSSKKTEVNYLFTSDYDQAKALGLATDCGYDRAQTISLQEVLYFGVKYDNREVTSLALQNGASAQTTQMGEIDNAFGFATQEYPFALHYAALYCSPNVAQQLYAYHGATVDQITSIGRKPLQFTALAEATQCNGIQIAQVLIEQVQEQDRAAVVNYQSVEGMTTLMYAISSGSNNINLVTYLASVPSIDLNLEDNTGTTALGFSDSWTDLSTKNQMQTELYSRGGICKKDGAGC